MKLRRIAHIIRHPHKAMCEIRAKEKRIIRKSGIDADNTYYVIRCDLPECGFFAIFMYVLDHLAICNDNGYIPIIDIEKYNTLYKESCAVNGTTDPWLYYFKAPSSAKMGINYKNEIISAIKFPHYKAIYYYQNAEKNVLPSSDNISYLYKLVEKYIRFNDIVQSELDKACKIMCGQRVLGIHVRGTDMYTEGKQHPIPTGKTKDFTIIDEILKKHGLKTILLCTDADETVKLFKEHYGDDLITMDAIRQKDNSLMGLHKDKSLSERENHRYLLGLEVIKDMYLLSKCNVLLCGPSNVAFAAMIYNNNKYESIYYYA